MGHSIGLPSQARIVKQIDALSCLKNVFYDLLVVKCKASSKMGSGAVFEIVHSIGFTKPSRGCETKDALSCLLNVFYDLLLVEWKASSKIGQWDSF